MTFEPEQLYSRQIKEILGGGIDADGLLSVSDTIEYYFDHGALFKTSNITGVTVAASDTQYYEITNGVSKIRIFQEILSTLADDFSLTVYETPSRDLSAEADATEIPILVPNRTNVKELPLKIYSITQGSTLEYSDITNTQTLIDSTRFILGSSQGNVDGGDALANESIIQMDNENHNYVLAINNLNTEEREFFFKLVFGVPELLE